MILNASSSVCIYENISSLMQNNRKGVIVINRIRTNVEYGVRSTYSHMTNTPDEVFRHHGSD